MDVQFLTTENALSEMTRLWEAVPERQKQKGVMFWMHPNTLKIIASCLPETNIPFDLESDNKMFGQPIKTHHLIQLDYVSVWDLQESEAAIKAHEDFNKMSIEDFFK